MACRNAKMQSRIPFGIYLSIAAAVWVFWGPSLFDAYMKILRP
jgi:prepilin signal peptidase PulO-like enzyme (type II secretory pathway)